MSDVHPRLRKRPPGCTLDCGFKTAESPALRGFVAGAAGACDCGPLSCTKIERLASLRKPPCKVRFFVQNRSRKYRQKVTATTLFQITFHRGFSTSPTNGPRSFSLPKASTHSALLKGSHTAAYTPKQGPSGRGRYYYSRNVSHVSETLRGQVSERQTLPLLGLGRVYSRRTQRAFGTAMRLCASLFRGVAAPPGRVIFSGLY